MRTYISCPDCSDYMERRRSVVLPALAAHSNETGESAGAILDRYMTGVHARHLSGLSLAVTS